MKDKKKLVRVIKKYQNRRLYDISTSTYVVLEDIKQIIVDGEEIKVIDVKTDQDVTRSVLLQVLLEEELHGLPMFSNDFIYQIIRFYGKAFQSSLSPFLEQGVDLFRKMQKTFYEQIRDMYGKDKLSSGVELWKEFIEKQGPDIEGIVREQMQSSTSAFLKMQEQLQQQTRQLFNYMPFPFNQNKGKK
ncbi:MAG: polyhydroxyalkanoate synthesis repressor PhaR [Burkholderiales bacterium]|nr:polyhydroxyalkanoate synthesis repressor PhaR [Burkholderiales bacterium]